MGFYFLFPTREHAQKTKLIYAASDTKLNKNLYMFKAAIGNRQT
jgi:hypothetical protein